MNTPAFATVRAAVSTTHTLDNSVTVLVGLTAGEAVALMTDDNTTPISQAVMNAIPGTRIVWVDGWEFDHDEDAKVRREIAARSRMAWEDAQG